MAIEGISPRFSDLQFATLSQRGLHLEGELDEYDNWLPNLVWGPNHIVWSHWTLDAENKKGAKKNSCVGEGDFTNEYGTTGLTIEEIQ